MYINKIELEKEVVISIGKDKMTLKLQNMIILMINKIMYKYSQFYDYELKNECFQNAFLVVFKNYKKFKSDNDVFNFLTTIIKNDIFNTYNCYVYKVNHSAKIQKNKFISLSSIKE